MVRREWAVSGRVQHNLMADCPPIAIRRTMAGTCQVRTSTVAPAVRPEHTVQIWQYKYGLHFCRSPFTLCEVLHTWSPYSRDLAENKYRQVSVGRRPRRYNLVQNLPGGLRLHNVDGVL